MKKRKAAGRLKPFEGAWTRLQKGWMDEPTVSLPTKAKMPHASKMEKDLKTAIEKTNPRDGMTVSFHHHLRNGDAIVNRTMDILAELGIKNITLAASSLSCCPCAFDSVSGGWNNHGNLDLRHARRTGQGGFHGQTRLPRRDSLPRRTRPRGSTPGN